MILFHICGFQTKILTFTFKNGLILTEKTFIKPKVAINVHKGDYIGLELLQKP